MIDPDIWTDCWSQEFGWCDCLKALRATQEGTGNVSE